MIHVVRKQFFNIFSSNSETFLSELLERNVSSLLVVASRSRDSMGVFISITQRVNRSLILLLSLRREGSITDSSLTQNHCTSVWELFVVQFGTCTLSPIFTYVGIAYTHVTGFIAGTTFVDIICVLSGSGNL